MPKNKLEEMRNTLQTAKLNSESGEPNIRVLADVLAELIEEVQSMDKVLRDLSDIHP